MHDPAREARRWLAAGREDLEVARLVADDGRAAHACFLAQQAAEKAVKALHYGRGARSVIGHSVRELIERLDPRAAALDALLDAARELDLLYVPTRYPNGLQSGTPAEAFSAAQAERAIEFAVRVLDACGTEVTRVIGPA
jgi:HEPN domain-containing protein